MGSIVSPPCYIGKSVGNTFLDACKYYIETHKNCGGEISIDENGKEFAHQWGCRWFPSMREAKKGSFD